MKMQYFNIRYNVYFFRRPFSVFIPILFFKCYVGAAAAEGKDAKANTTCGSGEDRCYTKTDKDKKIETKCFKSADIKTDTMKDLECMEKDSEKICLCKTDNCNNPSGAAGPVLLSVVQIFALIVFSSILRLGMS